MAGIGSGCNRPPGRSSSDLHQADRVRAQAQFAALAAAVGPDALARLGIGQEKAAPAALDRGQAIQPHRRPSGRRLALDAHQGPLSTVLELVALPAVAVAFPWPPEAWPPVATPLPCTLISTFVVFLAGRTRAEPPACPAALTTAPPRPAPTACNVPISCASPWPMILPSRSMISSRSCRGPPAMSEALLTFT